MQHWNASYIASMFGFSTGRRGQIRFFLEGSFGFRHAHYLCESFFIICIYWLLIQTLRVRVALESSIQCLKLTKGLVVVVWCFGSRLLQSTPTLNRSPVNFVVFSSTSCACSSFFDWRRWFWWHSFLFPNKFLYSHSLWHHLWTWNDSHLVFFWPPWVNWLHILALSEPWKFHSVFLSWIPMGGVSHKHLDQGWCQLPPS